jgi:hypothetical protein
MAMLTVEGVYRDGRVELTERPLDVAERARVLVTFLPETGPGSDVAGEVTLQEREMMRQKAFAQMEEGINLGGPPYPKREDLHDRHKRS